MRKPQDDLRYQKTEALIQRTFRELLGEMDYPQITIQKLAERAQINRKTFYLHYPSVDALLIKMQKDIIEEFLEPVKGTKLPGGLERIVRNCYEGSERADPMNEKILKSKGRFPVENDPGAPPEREFFDEDYSLFSQEERPYLLTFVNAALGAMYRHWVEAGRKESVEEMIGLTVRLISGGIGG